MLALWVNYTSNTTYFTRVAAYNEVIERGHEIFVT